MIVDNSEQAMKFYKDIFGWKNSKSRTVLWRYWMVTIGDEKELGISSCLSRKGETAMPTMNTISLSSIDKFSNLIQIKVARY